MKYGSARLHILLLMMVTLLGRTDSVYRTDYLQDSCSCSALHQLRCQGYVLAPVIGGAGHVALSRHPKFFRHFYCQFTIQAPPGLEVELRVNQVAVPESRDCDLAELRIYDGVPSSVRGEPVRGLCGNGSVTETVIRSTQNALTIYYFQGQEVLHHQKAFNVTYTYLHKPIGEEKCADETEFKCKNGACVHQHLKCDGYNNCGDLSDESLDLSVCGQYARSDPMVSVIVGSVMAGVVTVGVLAAVLVTVLKRRRSAAATAQSSEVIAHHHQRARRSSSTEARVIATQNFPQTLPSVTIPPAAAVPVTAAPPSGSVTNCIVSDIMHRCGIDAGTCRACASIPDTGTLRAEYDQPPPAYSDLFPDL